MAGYGQGLAKTSPAVTPKPRDDGGAVVRFFAYLNRNKKFPARYAPVARSQSAGETLEAPPCSLCKTDFDLEAELLSGWQPFRDSELFKMHLDRRKAGAAADLVPSTRAPRQAMQHQQLQPRNRTKCRGAAQAGSAINDEVLGQSTEGRRLTNQEELKLARALQLCQRIERAAGQYASQHGKPPSARQLAEATGYDSPDAVQAAIQKGWASWRRLVDANKPLVLFMAGKLRGLGLDTEDLVAEGMLALEQAALGFKPDRENARFSTYAGTVIFRNMLRAVHSYGRVVPIPVRMHQVMVKVRSVERDLQGSLGRDPTTPELAAAAGVGEEELRRLRAAFRPPLSLVEGAQGGGRREMEARDALAEDVEYWAQNDPFITGSMLDVAEAVRGLKPNQAQALDLRHGLSDQTPRKWREVGEEMQLSHQRAVQIHQAAVEKLRKRLGPPPAQ